jgi:hypothetical protein
MFIEAASTLTSNGLPENINSYIVLGTMLAGTIFGMVKASKSKSKKKAAAPAPKSVAQTALRGVRRQ